MLLNLQVFRFGALSECSAGWSKRPFRLSRNGFLAAATIISDSSYQYIAAQQ
jgi:hypothetical protein